MLVDIVVEQGTDGVVGRGHGMEVTGEVQVDFLHRQHLCIAATGSTSLDSETGSERRFPQGHGGLFPDFVQPQRQADADGGLADAGLRRTDGCHQDQTALLHLLLIDQRYRHFGHIPSVGLNILRGYS